MVTGRFDSASFIAGLTSRVDGESIGCTKCCHIFPDSLANVVAGSAAPTEYESAPLWTILTRFGCRDICEELGLDSKNANLHRLENIMTLDVIVRDTFDQMDLWFEPVNDQEHTYKIVLAARVQRLAEGIVPQEVTFTSHHPELPLPSPKYLRIHAACCRIAHMSGAAEYLDLVLHELEEMQVLACDGTSADVLSFALRNIMPP
ncbi:hypothetical protein OH77DRAFT_1429787 [Trametes cingulata]|nr:hypothetical protein OH77DRAFT_1429787 [Trametes cingulata]